MVSPSVIFDGVWRILSIEPAAARGPRGSEEVLELRSEGVGQPVQEERCQGWEHGGGTSRGAENREAVKRR